MLLYIIVFAVIAFLAVEYEFRPIHNKAPLVIISIVLILMAGFRSPEVARDYESYLYNFEIVKEIDDWIFLTIMEPAFIAIVYVICLFSDENYGFYIMLFFATFAVLLKVKSIDKLAFNPYLVLLLYYSHYFVLHEMTQIRIGLASAIFLASIPYYLKNNYKVFVPLVLIAALFHYSSIYFLLILFFDKKSFSTILYTIVIGLSLALGIVRLPLTALLSRFDASDVSVKLNTYVELGQAGLLQNVNVFNIVTVLNLLCCLYMIFIVPRDILLSDKKLLLFLKCNILSIFFLCLLSGVPTIAFRFMELFGIVSMFLFAYLVKFLPFKKANPFVLVALAGFMYYVAVFYGEGLLQEYKVVPIK
jgi:hypothetical protein